MECPRKFDNLSQGKLQYTSYQHFASRAVSLDFILATFTGMYKYKFDFHIST